MGTNQNVETNQDVEAGHERPGLTLPDRPQKSLSPSRATDFMSCPQLYKYKVIDKLPEPPGLEAVRGTLVHTVLEWLYDHDPMSRTQAEALALLPRAWEEYVAENPEIPALILGPEENWERHLAGQDLPDPETEVVEKFLHKVSSFVSRYFTLEDPTRIRPEARELPVSIELDSGLTLRGVIDRLEVAPTGQIRVVDYKTGRAPGEGWEAKALFQMRFYGLAVWKLRGRIPDRLMLLYLGSDQSVSESPTEAQLRSTEAKINAVWQAIERSEQQDRWQPAPSRLCSWCSFQDICPAQTARSD